jgi:thiosulfate/3-mercaptopyruvate sulfurtransferase
MNVRWMRMGQAAALALMLGTAAGAVDRPGPEPGALRAKGKLLYDAHCARCHGDDGSDTQIYPNVKSLVNVTQRYPANEILEKSKGFATLDLSGESGPALVAFLDTFRAGGYARPELLVETGWVALHLQAPGVRIVDMRPAEAYAAGHIPGAVRVAEGPLRDPNDPLDYLPRPEAFADMMGKAGIGTDTHVVIYDDQGGRSAARLWFILNAYGHEKVSLVNGGWLKWAAEQRPASAEAPAVPAAQFTPRKIPAVVCAAPELLARKPKVVVLDTRSAAEFRGEQMSGGAKKAGRIPNSVNVDWKENVAGPHMVFKSAPELKKLYESKGVTPDKEVVTY